MNRAMIAALLCCWSIASALSCAREEAAKEPPGSRAAGEAAGTATGETAGEAARKPPEIPIDVMPRVLDAPISYPDEARNRGEEGTVYVQALVDKDGKVTQAVIESAEPASDVLGKAALDGVKQWTFEPAEAKGEPVEVWIIVPVKFKLD